MADDKNVQAKPIEVKPQEVNKEEPSNKKVEAVTSK